MIVLNETRDFIANVGRTYDSKNNSAYAFVTETKTTWRVSIQICGYELPSVLDWVYKKSLYPSRFDAIRAAFVEARANGNI